VRFAEGEIGCKSQSSNAFGVQGLKVQNAKVNIKEDYKKLISDYLKL
jgi:hypothetical protein